MALFVSLFQGLGLPRTLILSLAVVSFSAFIIPVRYLGSFHSILEANLINDSPPSRHTEDAAAITFSIMKRGGYFYNTTREKNLVIDALSVGTLYNLKLLGAQAKTWATHRSIRHYFAATEKDDADKTCYRTLNKTQIENIVNHCVTEQPLAKGVFKIQYKKAFVKGSFAQRGAGWMCAQQRVAVGIETLGRYYRMQANTLPDYLLLQDDDTYYNMMRMEEFLNDKDPSIPLAEAPCLIRHALLDNFSFPWGGYGLVLSRGAIKNLIRPISCTNESDDEFEQNVCARLEDDMLGERQHFRNGMSVSDLMGAHVRGNLFTKFSHNNWGYCLHSDWVVGYFINYYYISSAIKGFKNHVRIEGTLGGTFKEDKGNCVHGNVTMCTEAAHVCHRQTVKSMLNQTVQVAKTSPDSFPLLSLS